MGIRDTAETLKLYLPLLISVFTGFWFLTSIFIAGLYSMYGDRFVHSLQNELGIIEVKEKLASLTGEDRVIYQPPGQSFVVEPVVVGKTIEYIMTFRRTVRGKDCILKNVTPIYTKSNGVALIGSYEFKGVQYDTNLTRADIDLPFPPELTPGRTVLQLQLEYTCNGLTVFELTDPVIFEVISAKDL